MTCSEPGCWSFGRCVCGFWESFSVALGLVSTLTVCCSNVPHLILIWRLHASQAVSPFLFSFWLLADVCNLAGSMVSSLALAQIVWAVVVTFLCLVALLQQVYYSSCGSHWQQPERGSPAGHPTPDLQHPAASIQPSGPSSVGTADTADQVVSCAALPTPVARSELVLQLTPSWKVAAPVADASLEEATRPSQAAPSPMAPPPSTPASNQSPPSLAHCRRNWARALLWLCLASRCLGAGWGGPEAPDLPPPRAIAGQVLGWAVPASNFPAVACQIAKNLSRQSTAGLSLSLFVMRLLAKLLYLGSVVAGGSGWSYHRRNLPWTVDAAGQTLLLGTVCAQCVRSRRRVEVLPA